MRIQHNILAMNAYRNYTNNTSALSKNLEKLSSGYKINRAGDDAAGLAISEKMRAQITGLNAASKNAKDGISLVKTAEGALSEVHDMLNRMVSLANQSANGTYDNATDRVQLQKEIDQLKAEINRIADSANFNGIKLLDGSMDITAVGGVTYEAVTDAQLKSDKFFINGWTDDRWGATDQTKVGTNRENRLETEGGTAQRAGFQISLNGIGTVQIEAGKDFELQINGSTVVSFTNNGSSAKGYTASELCRELVKKYESDTITIYDEKGNAHEFTLSLDSSGQGLVFSAAPTETGDFAIRGGEVTWLVDGKEGNVTSASAEYVTAEVVPEGISGSSPSPAYNGDGIMPANGQPGPTPSIGSVTPGRNATYGPGTYAAGSLTNLKIALAAATAAAAASTVRAAFNAAISAASSSAVAFQIGNVSIKWKELSAIASASSTVALAGKIAGQLNAILQNKVTGVSNAGGSGTAVYKNLTVSFASGAIKVDSYQEAKIKKLSDATSATRTVDFSSISSGAQLWGATITVGTTTYTFSSTAGANKIQVAANATKSAIADAFVAALNGNSKLAATNGAVNTNGTVLLKSRATGSSATELTVSAVGAGGTGDTDVTAPTTAPTYSGSTAKWGATVNHATGKSWANGDSITFTIGSLTVKFDYTSSGWGSAQAVSGSLPAGFTLTFNGTTLEAIATSAGTKANPFDGVNSITIDAVTLAGASASTAAEVKKLAAAGPAGFHAGGNTLPDVTAPTTAPTYSGSTAKWGATVNHATGKSWANGDSITFTIGSLTVKFDYTSSGWGSAQAVSGSLPAGFTLTFNGTTLEAIATSAGTKAHPFGGVNSITIDAVTLAGDSASTADEIKKLAAAGPAGFNDGSVTITPPNKPGKPQIDAASKKAELAFQVSKANTLSWASGDSITFTLGANNKLTFTFDGNKWGPGIASGNEMPGGYAWSFDGQTLRIRALQDGAEEQSPLGTLGEVSALTLGGKTYTEDNIADVLKISDANWHKGKGAAPTADNKITDMVELASAVDFSDLTAEISATNAGTIKSALEAGDFTLVQGAVDDAGNPIDDFAIDFSEFFSDASYADFVADFTAGNANADQLLKKMAEFVTKKVNEYNDQIASSGYKLTNVRLHYGDPAGANGEIKVAAEGNYTNNVWVTGDLKKISSASITHGVIDTGLQNVTDNVTGGAAGVANTVVNFGNVGAWQDGAKITIGDTTYTIAIGEDSKFKNVKNVIDLTDAVYAKATTAGQKAVIAAQRLSQVAKNNSIFIVGADGHGNTTLQQRTEVKETTDMSTKDRLASYLGVSIANPDSVEKAEVGKALTLQIGDTSDSYNQLLVSIGDAHTTALGIANIDISTQEGAAAAVDVIKTAINTVSDIRGSLGATQNRLEHTQNNLSVMVENIQDAESSIRDTDVAEEMMSYVKNNILIQSAQAMLAQANQIPQGVLQLLG